MDDFNKYTKLALKEMLRSRGLLTEGDKRTLALRLKNAVVVEQMNQPNAAEFLADVEILTEQANDVNEENANSIEREEEQLAKESIPQEFESVREELDSIKHEKELLQQELEFVKQKLDTTKREKESLQQEFESVKREFSLINREKELLQENLESMQRQLNQSYMPSEARSSISSVTSTTSRDMPHEFNRRNNCK